MTVPRQNSTNRELHKKATKLTEQKLTQNQNRYKTNTTKLNSKH